jgi:hypothetical protein
MNLFKLNIMVKIFIAISLFSGFFISCATSKGHQEIVPDVVPGISETTSEIRELKHVSKAEEGHEVLNLTGHLYIKRSENGAVRILPCSKCNIVFRTVNDTATKGNMLTNENGEFSFNGLKSIFSFVLINQGLNKIEINGLDFSKGGKNSMVIINAAGDRTETFDVHKEGEEFKWILR